MNPFKKAALFVLSTVTFGFVLFSVASIGLTLLGVVAVLAVIGFIARPLLPKGPRKLRVFEGEATAA